MPEQKTIVINTSPLISLVAAWGTLEPLRTLYAKVWVPVEVAEEICRGGNSSFAVTEFMAADFLHKTQQPTPISPFLGNSLDKGEAAVIQLALDQGIQTVCIDETIGRRIARLNGLTLTGSVGVLVRYKQEQQPNFSLAQAIQRMQARGIRLGVDVIQFALAHD
jgi:predicted nucleic acid-binding protein